MSLKLILLFFTFILSGCTIDTSLSGLFTIDSVQVSRTSNTIREGHSASVKLNFPQKFDDIVIKYKIINISTTKDDFLIPLEGQFSLDRRQQLAISIPISNDNIVEGEESFSIEITIVHQDVSNSRTHTLNYIISPEESLPIVTINNTSVTEGGQAIFTVQLDKISSLPIKFDLTLNSQTATPTDDFIFLSSTTVTIDPGNLSKTIEISTVDDNIDEIDETFQLNLSSPLNATLASFQSTATIIDNDDLPNLSISDASANEGNNLTFTVSLDAISGKDISFQYNTTSDGIPSFIKTTPGSDYQQVNSTSVTILAGSISTTISIPSVDDSLNELYERFYVKLSSPVNSLITDNTGLAIIYDNDNPPSVTITSNSILTEGQSITYTATLSEVSGAKASFMYRATNAITNYGAPGTATDNIDFNAVTTSTTITIPKGQLSTTFTISSIQDTTHEPTETIHIFFNSTSGLAGIPSDFYIEILDDDPPSESIFSLYSFLGEQNNLDLNDPTTLSDLNSSGEDITYTCVLNSNPCSTQLTNFSLDQNTGLITYISDTIQVKVLNITLSSASQTINRKLYLVDIRKNEMVGGQVASRVINSGTHQIGFTKDSILVYDTAIANTPVIKKILLFSRGQDSYYNIIDIAIQNNYLLVASARYLFVFDLTKLLDEGVIKLISTIKMNGNDFILQMLITSTGAMFLQLDRGYRQYDITDIYNPIDLTSFSHKDSRRGNFNELSGNFYFTSYGKVIMHHILPTASANFNIPSSTYTTLYSGTSQKLKKLTVNQNTAYASLMYNKIIHKITDIDTTPVSSGNYTSTLIEVLNMVENNNILYLSGHPIKTDIIDFTNSANPTLIGTLDKFLVEKKEGTTLVARDLAKNYVKFNITTPTTLTLDPSQTKYSMVNPLDVLIDGDYLYVASKQSGLSILDRTNPQSPQLINSLKENETHQAISLNVNSTHIFTFNDQSTNSITVYDKNNTNRAQPTVVNQISPQTEASLSSSHRVNSLQIYNNYLLVVMGRYNSPGALLIYDISNILNIQLVNQLTLPSIPYHFSIRVSKLFTQSGHLYIPVMKLYINLLNINSAINSDLKLFTLSGAGSFSFIFKDGFLYTSKVNNITVYELTSIGVFTERSTLLTSSIPGYHYPTQLSYCNNILFSGVNYVDSPLNYGYIDVSNKSNLTQMSRDNSYYYMFPGVKVHNTCDEANNLYYSLSTKGLHTIDVGNRNNIKAP